jgi:DNA polymerase-3 subunit epsilon
MILLDTETTGLPDISITPLDAQPRIIELAAWKIDPVSFRKIGEINFLCDPGVPIPAKVTEITGITDADVKGKPSFARMLPILTDFFLGTKYMVAHNLPFDRQMIGWELERIGRSFQFPWPPEHICTVERSQDISGKFTSLTDLYVHYYGMDPGQKHRGEGDVAILYEVVKKMREEGRL